MFLKTLTVLIIAVLAMTFLSACGKENSAQPSQPSAFPVEIEVLPKKQETKTVQPQQPSKSSVSGVPTPEEIAQADADARARDREAAIQGMMDGNQPASPQNVSPVSVDIP